MTAPAGHVRVDAHPQLPAVLRRSADLASAAPGCRPSPSGWLVLHLSHNSGFAIGLAIALQFIPTLLFGVWGGVIADRFDKRTVLFVTQAAMAAVAVLLAVVDLTNVVQLWMLYAIVFAFGLALAVDNPTRQSFVPELVPPKDLPNAVGLSSAIFQVARILGPALGGVLIVAVGTGVCFALNAVSFVFIVAALLMMRTGELHREAPLGPREGPGARRPPLRLAHPRAAVDAPAHAHRRDVRDQLPGRPAAPGEDHVRRQRRGLQLDDDRDGGRGGRSARCSSASRAHARGTLLFATGMAFGVSMCRRVLRAVVGTVHRVAAGRGGGADLLPRHVQLAPPAPLRSASCAAG